MAGSVNCTNITVSENGRLTKQRFIEHYVRRHPTVTPTEDGVWSYSTQLLIAVECHCTRTECAGWVMVPQNVLANKKRQ